MIEQAQIFLDKISERIKNGEFDKYRSLFLSRELIFFSIKARVNKKIETGATPLLSEIEINDTLKDAKEIATKTLKIFIEIGILEKNEDSYIISEKWKPFI